MKRLAVRTTVAIVLVQFVFSQAPAAVRISASSASSLDCPVILTGPSVAVAPNQPAVEPQSTVGIINALCDVKLEIVGCLFSPTAISVACDANGDGLPELSIPLKDVTIVNRFLVEATLPALAPQLPGSAFPLACCGGIASITLTRTVGSGDDNVFGPFTQSQTCPIDLGIRAPVVISATPSGGDCAVGQNLVIPGSCFLLAGGKPNVTSVFAVEQNNPGHVIQSSRFIILNTNLIDALFDFGPASEGKTFLIFASGPNGTSRNLSALPAQAPQGCPLGNEQGVKVTFTCKGGAGGSDPGGTPADISDLLSCRLERNSSGVFILTLTGRFQEGASVSIGGVAPKKIKLKNFDPVTNRFSRMTLKGRVCGSLPASIVYFPPDARPASTLQCLERCTN